MDWGAPSKDAAGAAKEFLTFALGAEEYAVDILKVQEIRGYDSVTPIANTPKFIKGVINLRGSIVPIVDLRLKFNLETPTYNELTVVIILNIAERIVGIVVDGVSDVIALKPDQIKPAPEFSTTLDTKYLRGLANVQDKMLILVDIEELLRSRDLALFDELASRAPARA